MHPWCYFYLSSPVPSVPLQASDRTRDKLWSPLHWTPPTQKGHHIASNFSSRSTRIAAPPPLLARPLLYNSRPRAIILFPFLHFFTPSPPACIHHFIFPRAEPGLARRMVFVPRPATLFYRGSSRLLLTPELVAARPRKRERRHTRDCLEAAGERGVRLRTVEWGGVWVYAATPLRSTGRDNLVESLARRMESLNCPTLYVLSIIVSSHHKTSTDAENFNIQHYDIKAHFWAAKYIRKCEVLILHATH